MNWRRSTGIRGAILLLSCSWLSACGQQDLRLDNLNWDIQPDPIHRETVVRHSRPKDDDELFDPQEYAPDLRSIFAEADAITERLVGNVPRDENFGAVFWATKKRLLSQEYDIDWRSPAEINPDISYGGYGQRVLSETEQSTIRTVVLPYLDSDRTEVTLVERRFSGEVNAWASVDDERYVFVLTGHRDEWEVESFGRVEY